VRIRIESSGGDSRIVEVNGEVTIGRTNAARIVVDDSSVSRLHATIWKDDGDVWIVDENSTNGTYVNEQKIIKPTKLRVGDRVRLGFDTFVFLEPETKISSYKPEYEISTEEKQTPIQAGKVSPRPPRISVDAPRQNKTTLLMIALLAIFLVSFFGLLTFFIARRFEDVSKPVNKTVRSGLPIPVRVIDPLGGEDPEDLDDLIASWEVEEKELKAEDLAELTNLSSEASDLNVSVSFWQKQRELALSPRIGVTGIAPPGLQVPPELFGDGVIKQKAKLAEMLKMGYQQPMDFADLAKKKLAKELVELPLATESYFLDVGGSATDEPFMGFNFDVGNFPLSPGNDKYEVLRRLADDFDGQKYDLNNPLHRKQMRIRLLRMFHPRAKPILKEIADAYLQRFGRPLRVTSLTRSMDYQIELNKTNPNSFKVRGAGSLPPHTSGCAFDLARKHMTVEEQNFLMQKLAEMERRGVLDALIEYNQNACFHIFIYPDGRAP